MEKYEKIAQELGVSLKQIDTVLTLTAEGSTIPFIARYRKDATGNLDEVAIKAIIDMDKSLTALADRKETVLAKIEELGKLTPALKEASRRILIRRISNCKGCNLWSNRYFGRSHCRRPTIAQPYLPGDSQTLFDHL